MDLDLIDHPLVVGDPKRMIREEDSGAPICPECFDDFNQCTCPKPGSAVDSDGYQIMIEDDRLIAYPTSENYETLMLWITGTFGQLQCALCGKTMESNGDSSDIEANEIVEAFFEIHRRCYSPREDYLIPHDF